MTNTTITEEGPMQVDLPKPGLPAEVGPPPAKVRAPTAKLGAAAAGALAVGALAIGALAIGRLVVGRMAVGKLAVGKASLGRARLHHLEIDELVVRHLRAPEAGPTKRPALDHPVPRLPRPPKGWRWRRR
jgi:hypothetical protein